MENRAITPTTPTAPAVAPAVERNLQDILVGPSDAVQALQGADIVGRVVDETSGETIHEIPPEQLKALDTKMREQLAPLVEVTA